MGDLMLASGLGLTALGLIVLGAVLVSWGWR